MPKVCQSAARVPRSATAAATRWSRPSGASTRTSRRCGSTTAGTARRVYVCTRCLKAGKVTKAYGPGPPRRRRLPVSVSAPVSDPSLVRFRAVVEARARRSWSRAARRSTTSTCSRSPTATRATTWRSRCAPCWTSSTASPRPSGDRTIDEIGRDEIVSSVARAALLGARGNSGVILSQLIRGAAEELVSPARRAGRPGADRRGAGARRRARLRVGARAGRGHDPHRRARDGAPRSPASSRTCPSRASAATPTDASRTR